MTAEYSAARNRENVEGQERMAFKNNSTREPIAGKAYASIKRRILDLTLAPGETLSEQRLAAEFGLSRTPVREAFKRLENEGLVDVVPQQGTFVSPIRRELVMDAQFARASLECALVRLASQKRTEHDIVLLLENLEAQERVAARGDFDTLFRLDEEMHEAIAAIAGRPNIWSLISDIKIHMDRARKLTLRPDHIPTLLKQHKAILDAIGAGDPDRSEATMNEHLSFIVEHFDEFIAANPTFVREVVKSIF
jgi:GntR family transcriptional regulator, rspAB operon transcriptional repressor